ncbi:GNAT superfamily N-acetyltransferase [Pedobacter cryoconitis]|uniref:GNAT superfamily N-acetyltransferase n=1 Tax=Pedobacter cryoconitis TaxID=188932 RepID=A0A7W8ZPU2_9SPHI|nr:GNAT family N-acetyltransferase [Pedobacter cryoconitis]MBB5637983.1 GNAT superfamily N-acetyltransferase [Pedobacter cryoconitis]
MIKLVRTDSENQDFINLVKHLDEYLAEKNSSTHSFYDQFNKIDKIKHVVVVYKDDQPIGCGAIKQYATNTMEIKRMYTSPNHRGKGIASNILTELEIWATELAYQKCILETGTERLDAIKLYKKNGYVLIPNYGQYAEIETSVCFQKEMIRLF